MSSGLLNRLINKNKPEPVSVYEEDQPVTISSSILPPDAPSRETAVEPLQATSQVPDEVTASVKPRKPKAKKEEPTAPEQAGEPEGFDLYVDCIPVHGSDTMPIQFERIIAPYVRQVAEEGGVADLRFLKYGEGKARLAVVLRENLDKFPRIVTVTSMAEFSAVFLEVVTEHARLYVRALRG